MTRPVTRHGASVVAAVPFDLHAEMDALNNFELLSETSVHSGWFRLYSSLELCPMCVTRILFSGIGVVRYAVCDVAGGMSAIADRLPPIFAGWAEERDIADALVSPDLASLALAVHDATLPNALQHVAERWDLLRK